MLGDADGGAGPSAMRGWLCKMGGGSWRRRYFVLHGQTFTYFNQLPTPAQLTQPENNKNTIDMSTVVDVTFGTEQTWPEAALPANRFGIVTPKKTYYLYGEDVVEARTWRHVLQSAAGLKIVSFCVCVSAVGDLFKG